MLFQQPIYNHLSKYTQYKSFSIYSIFSKWNKSVLFVLCLLGISACSNEQAIQQNVLHNTKQQLLSDALPLSISPSGNLKEQDLALFAEKISKVKVLALGEQTHGAGSIFSIKADLIKYLHKHHDFDLFILESGMYDVDKIYQQAKKGKRIKDMAQGNIFYMYANSDEVTPLFDYIDEQASGDNPLILVGFDSQHTGGLSNKGLVGDLTVALQESSDDWSDAQNWPIFAKQIQQVLNGTKQRLPKNEEQLFFKQLNRLSRSFI
jgi:erythromycin esterase